MLLKTLRNRASLKFVKVKVSSSCDCLNAPRCRPMSEAVGLLNTQEERNDLNKSESKQTKPFSDIPGPKGLPFVGTLFNYRSGQYSPTSFHKAILSNYKKYGQIYKERINGETRVHLLNPDYIKVVFQNEGKVPFIPPLLETTQRYRRLRGLSPGLGNTNGEEWYRLRSAVQQMMMRPKAVTMYLQGVNEVINDFLHQIERLRHAQTGEIHNLRTELLKWQLESSGMTCFETRLGCFDAEPGSHVYKMIEANADIFALSLKLKFSLPFYKYFPSQTWKKLVEAEDYFFGKGQDYVDATVKKISDLQKAKQLGGGKYGFMVYLLGKQELSYKDLSIISLSLFGDGLSTTVPSLIGQLYCLSSNPDKQQRAYEEIMSVVPPGEDVSADMISQLSYLKACVKEGFRFFPIGTGVSRINQKDLIIGGYEIPSGTHLELENNMLLRLPEYFQDPDSYVPERWVRGEAEQRVHPYLLVPFGHGPRMCAGRRFAEQEMYVLLSKLLQKYKLEWNHNEPIEQVYNMLLKPNKQPLISFVPRN